MQTATTRHEVAIDPSRIFKPRLPIDDDFKKWESGFEKVFYRFKLWVSFYDRNNKSFYGLEKTGPFNFKQIFFGWVTEIVLSEQLGYDKSIWMAEQKFKGTYQTAVLYDTKTNPNGDIIAKWVHGELEFATPPDLSNPIKRYIPKREIVENSWSINFIEHVDFKSEIHQNLA